MIACLLVCAAMAADAQNAASHAAPAPAAPLVATPASALQKRRDDLQTAIVKDDLPRIAAFIRSGMQLDFNFDDEAPRQRSSESPLTMAVNRNKLEVARLLLDAGADAKRMDGFGRGPIHLVKSADMARLLVKAGADPNALNRRGYTGLAEAVWDGQLDRIDALLAAGARFDAPAKNPDVFTIAVQMRKGSLIPALVERGADPRRPPTQVLGPLIDDGNTPAALALLRAGADPNARNQFGPVLLIALFRKRWEVAEALADAGAELNPADPPQCAGGYGCWSIQTARLASFEPSTLTKLASRGLDLNRVASDGHTALTSLIVEQPLAIRAVKSTKGAVAEIPAADNVARVRAVLGVGADPNAKYREDTPLMLAIERGGAFGDAVFDAGGRVEYSQLIPAEVPPSVPTVAQGRAPRQAPYFNYRGVNTGMTVGPLTWTVLHNRGDLAVRMLQRDRKLEPSDRHLIYFAAFLGQWDVILAALAYKPDVNAGDRADVMPLMMAAQDGRADVVRALLASGAKVNTRSDRSWPPLLERDFKTEIGAAVAGHSPAPPRLVGGYTALRAAKERGHADVVRILSEAGGRE